MNRCNTMYNKISIKKRTQQNFSIDTSTLAPLFALSEATHLAYCKIFDQPWLDAYKTLGVSSILRNVFRCYQILDLHLTLHRRTALNGVLITINMVKNHQQGACTEGGCIVIFPNYVIKLSSQCFCFSKYVYHMCVHAGS